MDEQKPETPVTWQYNPESETSPLEPAQTAPEAVTWTASEFIAHEKNAGWYVMFGVSAAIVTALTYILSRDVISPIIIVIIAITFGIAAARKPRTLPYAVDGKGIHVDQKTYPYETFKSFALIQEGGIRSITLLPLKRFLPPISLYVDPEDEERIIDVIAQYLPVEQREQDPIDRLMRRVRF